MIGCRAVDRQPRICAFDGCDRVVLNRLGFCVSHHGIAWPCSFDASCKYRCAAHSKTRLCQEHAWYAEKMRREARAQLRENILKE